MLKKFLKMQEPVDASQLIRAPEKHVVLIICLYEAIGTAMMLLAMNWGLTATRNNYSTEMCVCITFFVAYVILGPISGGHFNPAITFAFLLNNGRLNTKSSIKQNLLVIGS